MQARVRRWGNSLAIRIPAGISREVALGDGDAVELQIEDGALLIRPIQPDLTIEELVAGISDDNLHAPTEWGNPVGREAW